MGAAQAVEKQLAKAGHNFNLLGADTKGNIGLQLCMVASASQVFTPQLTNAIERLTEVGGLWTSGAVVAFGLTLLVAGSAWNILALRSMRSDQAPLGP